MLKEINKLIIAKIAQINVIILFLIFSFPIWKHIHQEQEIADTVALTGYTFIEEKNPINYVMYPMSDEKAISSLKPCHLTVKNDLKEDIDYTLALSISKESTMNLNNLNILINDRVDKLTNLKCVEEYDYIYFILDNDNLINQKNEYDVIFWLNEDTSDLAMEQELIFSFEIIDNSIKS